MAKPALPTAPVPQTQHVDPETGQLTRDALQKLNEIINTLRDHETRLNAGNL